MEAANSDSSCPKCTAENPIFRCCALCSRKVCYMCVSTYFGQSKIEEFEKLPFWLCIMCSEANKENETPNSQSGRRCNKCFNVQPAIRTCVLCESVTEYFCVDIDCWKIEPASPGKTKPPMWICYVCQPDETVKNERIKKYSVLISEKVIVDESDNVTVEDRIRKTEEELEEFSKRDDIEEIGRLLLKVASERQIDSTSSGKDEASGGDLVDIDTWFDLTFPEKKEKRSDDEEKGTKNSDPTALPKKKEEKGKKHGVPKASPKKKKSGEAVSPSGAEKLSPRKKNDSPSRHPLGEMKISNENSESEKFSKRDDIDEIGEFLLKLAMERQRNASSGKDEATGGDDVDLESWVQLTFPEKEEKRSDDEEEGTKNSDATALPKKKEEEKGTKHGVLKVSPTKKKKSVKFLSLPEGKKYDSPSRHPLEESSENSEMASSSLSQLSPTTKEKIMEFRRKATALDEQMRQSALDDARFVGKDFKSVRDFWERFGKKE